MPGRVRATDRVGSMNVFGRDLASFLIVLCLIADYVVLAMWLDRNFTKAESRWRITMRDMLATTAFAAFQLWILF